MSKAQLVVKSETVLLQELKTTATDFLKDWSSDHTFNFSNVILATMTIVEKYSSENVNMASTDKFQMAQSLISTVIDIAVQMGKIKPEEGDSLKKNFAQSEAVVKELMETYIELSQNPQLIQVEKAVEAEVSGCLGCKKR